MELNSRWIYGIDSRCTESDKTERRGLRREFRDASCSGSSRDTMPQLAQAMRCLLLGLVALGATWMAQYA